MTIKGIKANTDIGLFLDLGDPISIANFPEEIVKTNVLEKKVNNNKEKENEVKEDEKKKDEMKKNEKKEWFVEPGIIQKFSYVARIPEDIRFILVRSRFNYHETSRHSVQKVF